MALRIFATDPDAKPAPRKKVEFSNDFAFQFRSGRQVNNRPVSLPNWRVTTGDPLVADAVSLLMGGKPDEWETSKEDYLEVLTETDSVEIVINGSKAIEDKLILWGRSGPVHECDGEFFLSPAEDKGKPCRCPQYMTERKELARSGRGPAPHIVLNFRLAHDYDLGKGRLISTAWTLAEVIHEVKDALDAIDGEALCRLELVHVQFTNKAGINVDYRKPVITVLGSYNDAIAEER
jgi:hypothetical protein